MDQPKMMCGFSKKHYDKLSTDPQNEALSIDDKIAKLLNFKQNFKLMFGIKPALRWNLLSKVSKDKRGQAT